jgi:hypothetical protein
MQTEDIKAEKVTRYNLHSVIKNGLWKSSEN